MTLVIVASTNHVKCAAARDGFQRMFPDDSFAVEAIAVESGVADQPMTDGETRRGAYQRAAAARAARPDAEYWVGIEGGIEAGDDRLLAFAWVVVLGRAREGASRTAAFTLPDEVAALVRQGMELGHADDIVFGRSNSKQQNGAVGLLTGDVVNRAAYYAHAVVLALIPFRNPALTFPTG